MSLWLSPYAIGAFLVIFLGYLATNAVLHIYFYERRAEVANSWKIQAHKKDSGGSSSSSNSTPFYSPAGRTTDENGSRIPWPWRSDKTGRSPQHALYATLNLMVASSFALLTAEGTVRGIGSRLHTQWPPSGGSLLLLGWLVGQAGLVVPGMLWQNVWEYYWHRLMHVPSIYRRFHKHHHFYNAPSPFDDMYIAPLEALGYYFILYSPALVVPMHVASFAVYMTILGASGILDHSGIDVRVFGGFLSLFWTTSMTLTMASSLGRITWLARDEDGEDEEQGGNEEEEIKRRKEEGRGVRVLLVGRRGGGRRRARRLSFPICWLTQSERVVTEGLMSATVQPTAITTLAAPRRNATISDSTTAPSSSSSSACAGNNKIGALMKWREEAPF